MGHALQVFEQGFAQVFADVLRYEAMGVAQVIFWNARERIKYKTTIMKISINFITSSTNL